MNKPMITFSILPVLLFGQAPIKSNGARPVIPAPQVVERIDESTLEIDLEVRRIGALPIHRCVPRPRSIRLGRADNFSPAGPEPLFVSPTARAIWGSRLAPFDFASPDRIFAVSMNLGQCKLCGERDMKVSLKIKRLNAGSAGDKAYLHFSNGLPNSSGISPAISVANLWVNEAPSVTEKIVTLTIPLAQVNNYILHNGAAFLEIVVQDDTAIDYVTVNW